MTAITFILMDGSCQSGDADREPRLLRYRVP